MDNSINQKKIWQINDKVRIRELDKFNLVVERLETNRNHRAKKFVTSWNLVGYYSTILQALESIIIKNELIDKSEISTLEDYVIQVEKSNSEILKFIDKMRKEESQNA